jgi:hypothetical protein
MSFSFRGAGLRPRPVQIVDQWCQLIEGMQFSAQEFYQRLEGAIELRKIPELHKARVEWREGGPMTAKRQYLRLQREGLLFDICGMPFGTGFVVSEWLYMRPIRIMLIILALLVIILASAAVITSGPHNPVYRHLRHMGLDIESTTHLVLCVPLIAVLGTLLWIGPRFDEAMLSIPRFGDFYLKYIRRINFCHEDRTAAFRRAVHDAVCDVVNEITKDQGIPPLTDLDRHVVNPNLDGPGYRRGRPHALV